MARGFVPTGRATWPRPIGDSLFSLGLCHDRRYPPEVAHRLSARHRIARSVLRRSSQRVCSIRHRPGAVSFEASRPCGKHSGGFSCRPPPRGEVGHRDWPSVSRPTSRCPPPPVASRPGHPRRLLCPGNRPGGAPFDNRRLPIPADSSQNCRRLGRVRSLASFPPPNQIGLSPSSVLRATE